MSKDNRKASLRSSSGNVTINKFYKSWEKAPDIVKGVGRCDDGQYEVEKILQLRHQKLEKDVSTKYLVKWNGWANIYNSFATEEETGDCKGKIKIFIQNLVSLRRVSGEEKKEEFLLFKKSLEVDENETDEEEHQEEDDRQESEESQPELETTLEIENSEMEEDEEGDDDVIEMEGQEEGDDESESEDDADHGNDTPVIPLLQVISEPSEELIEMLKRLKVIPIQE